jgi:hypothetical protein
MTGLKGAAIRASFYRGGYQLNVKAYVEVMELHRKVDRLLEVGNLKK